MTYPFPPPLDYHSGTTTFTGTSIPPRYIFLITMVLLLFITKAFISSQMESIIILPDETVYGSDIIHMITKHPLDLSLYTPFPTLLDYHSTLLINCLLTSLCAIPVFFIFLRHHSEQKAALLTSLIMLAPCLWVYSLVNMTEATLFLVTLIAAWNPTNWKLELPYWKGKVLEVRPLDWLSPLVKPTGIATALARYPNGLYLALGFGLLYTVLFTGPFEQFMMTGINPITNCIMAVWHLYSYLFIATAGMFCFLLYRYFTTGIDEDDWFALMLVIVTFALIFPFCFKIPFDKMYGRYLDAASLVVLTTALKPIQKGPKFIAFVLVFAGIAAAYMILFPKASLLDSGAMLFTDAIKNTLMSSHILAGGG